MILLNRRHSERKYFNLLHSVHQTFLHLLQNILHLWFAQFQTQLIITSTLWTWSTDWKKSICMLKIASWSSISKTQSGRLVQKDQFLTSECSIRAHTGEKKNVFNVKTKSSSQLALVVKLWPQTCKRRRKAASRGTARTVKLELNKTDMSWVRSERLSTYGWRNFHFQVGCWN